MDSSSFDRMAERLRMPSGILLGVVGVLWAVAVWQAPLDRVQGVIQKILYVHPPLAFSAYLGFILTGIGGALYLRSQDEKWDRLAASAAEVGLLFCTLMIVTGPIWARGTWGRWWSWDLRLTLTLLLWFVYLAYLLLRSFTEPGARTARFASVYGIVGLLVIPLNYFAIDLAGGRGIHPENLERGSLGAGMGWPFLLGVVASLLAFVHLLSRRVEVAGLRVQVARKEAAQVRSAEGRPE